MAALLKLVRWKNLIIVALTQLGLQYLVIIPYFKRGNMEAALDAPHFFLLVLSTMLIAAGGYIINDIIDYSIDLINKPNKVILNNGIAKQGAWLLYWGLTLAGFALSLYLAIHIENIPLVTLYPSAVLLLFLYSRYFKQRVLIGNIVVSIFCAFVAGIVWFAERHTISALKVNHLEEGLYLQYILGIYLTFAFLSTLYREIIKDMEDVEGDLLYGCQTLPIVFGNQVAKNIALTTGFLLLAFLLHTAYFQWQFNNWSSLLFIAIVINVPLLYSFYLLYEASTSADFAKLSTIAKVIMLLGLILLLLL